MNPQKRGVVEKKGAPMNPSTGKRPKDPKENAFDDKVEDKRASHLTTKAKDNDIADNTSSDDEVSSEDATWISWFCSLRGNEFFCEVDEEYITDEFNLTGLRNIVPNYDYALDVILDTETDDILTEEQQEIVESAAEMLYGLIHARYILTPRGMASMLEKFNNVEFGRCPRVFCQGQPVLPVGQTDVPRMNTVKVFCPKCEDIYYPKYSRHCNIDGAYFGTTFPHLFLQVYPECYPPKPTLKYVPRIYGFKIHPTARQACLKAAAKAAKK